MVLEEDLNVYPASPVAIQICTIVLRWSPQPLLVIYLPVRPCTFRQRCRVKYMNHFIHTVRRSALVGDGSVRDETRISTRAYLIRIASGP